MSVIDINRTYKKEPIIKEEYFHLSNWQKYENPENTDLLVDLVSSKIHTKVTYLIAYY